LPSYKVFRVCAYVYYKKKERLSGDERRARDRAAHKLARSLENDEERDVRLKKDSTAHARKAAAKSEVEKRTRRTKNRISQKLSRDSKKERESVDEKIARREKNRLAQIRSRAQKSEEEKAQIRQKQQEGWRDSVKSGSRPRRQRRYAKRKPIEDPALEQRAKKLKAERQARAPAVIAARKEQDIEQLSVLWQTISETEKQQALEEHKKRYEDFRRLFTRGGRKKPKYRKDAIRRYRLNARQSVLARHAKASGLHWPSKNLCLQVFGNELD
jgi:hypothetical protein